MISEGMSGLSSPRGLAFGPDGGLYVAEAGRGGDGPSFMLGSRNEAFLGSTSALSRLLGGVQERVLDGLPSLATANGLEANGLSDIVFDSVGQAIGLIGLGGDPTQRAKLGEAAAELGAIVRLPLDGSGSLEHVADVAAFEISSNPDGTNLDTNPFGLAMTPGGDYLVADAGGNAVLAVTAAGEVSTLAVLPARPNPLPPPPPVFQSVPTAVAIGPDSAYYIGQLTGFPFTVGSANVYRVDPVTRELSVAYSDFTNIVDLTFDEDGSLYVLQISTNGLASPMGPGSGVVLKIDRESGARTTIVSDGLTNPTSVVAGPDRTLYVTNNGRSIDAGQVLRIAPQLQAGDANQDLSFDQFDVVQVQTGAKYLTGQSATWGEGDWNGAPGGRPGNPPAGDSLFNQFDIIAAQQSGLYLAGPYAAVVRNGQRGDGQASIVYHAGTGEIAVDAPVGTQLTSINIDSAARIFTGSAAANLGGSFDNDADNNIFKATFGSSFGSLSFGNAAQAGLSEQFVLGDLSVVGSLAGGGDLGNVDLIYVPEPAALVLAVVGLLSLVAPCPSRRPAIAGASGC
jgi:hypothetical protein